ncbi:MAG: phosphotransferase [Chromatiales bacterium]|nr:phosphotransferase [Chromatiales bacterium]
MQGLEVPKTVLSAWNLEGATVSPLGSGLINGTWLVSAGPGRYVLQQLNPIFPAAINEDIRIVTAHLRARGLVAPELLPTVDGRLWVDEAGGAFRLMTHIDGVSHERLESAGEAREAGQLLARFHRALADLRHEFRNQRLGVHDTARHLGILRQSLVDHAAHRDIAAIGPLAAEILQLADALPPLPVLPDRIVHGDPKINNLLFDVATGRALCFIDLDTLGRMPLPLELGDAFRSWCNPKGEDSPRSAFALDLFTAAVDGYAAGAKGWITPEESAAIVPGTLTIYVELAARFCADALRECYFGWDAQRYPSRSAHNQVRAGSQLTAARALWDVRGAAEEVVRRAFG